MILQELLHRIDFNERIELYIDSGVLDQYEHYLKFNSTYDLFFFNKSILNYFVTQISMSADKNYLRICICETDVDYLEM